MSHMECLLRLNSAKNQSEAEAPAVIALAAASVTRDSLHRLLAKIAAECDERAPPAHNKKRNVMTAQDESLLRDLENYAAVLEHLSEFVCGTKQWFPVCTLKEAEWDYEIAPRDISTEDFVLRFVKKAVQHAKKQAAGATGYIGPDPGDRFINRVRSSGL